MSDMHVLDGNGSTYRVVMHFPVSGGNNSVGTAWSTALLESAGFNEDGTPATPTTALRTIDTIEKDAIEAGTVFEHVGNFRIESGGTSNAALRASLREFYGLEKTRVIAEIQTRLRYFSHMESEV